MPLYRAAGSGGRGKGLKYQLNVVNPFLPELLQSLNSFSLHRERHSLKRLLLCVHMDVCLQLKTHIYP